MAGPTVTLAGVTEADKEPRLGLRLIRLGFWSRGCSREGGCGGDWRKGEVNIMIVTKHWVF